MSIDSAKRILMVGLMALTVPMMGPVRLGAVTVELDDDGNEAVDHPEPSRQKVGSPAALGGVSENKASRTRIGEKIGFYYFMKAGFVVPNESKLPIAGKIVGSSAGKEWYHTGDKIFVELSTNQTDVKNGDLLVVSRLNNRVEESNSGFSGWWVRNLAVVRVLEVEKRKCFVEVTKTFCPFHSGDRVRLYDDEIVRWKQAQIKKNLPDHAIQCYVSFAESKYLMISQTDFFVLTAGSKKGVVEGQRFQLKDTTYPGGQPNHAPQGFAQVFYVGPNYSMAEVLVSSEPIKRGFEALYQP